MLRKMLLAGIVMGLISTTAFAVEESNKSFPGISFEVMQDKLVFDEKGDDYLMFCKRRFDITSYTLIKNESGMIISLDDLDVPCEAMVSYYKKPGKKRRYVVLSIEIQGAPQPNPK